MTLYQLEVFVLVAKFQSFTGAAKELHLGQPSVSSLVIQLQKELGVKLFEKLGLKSHLTETGKRFFRKAETILALVQEAKDEVEELKGLKKGKISVGSAGVGASLILPVIEKFKEQHPGVDVSLTIQKTQALHQKLLDGELDIAILGLPPTSPLIAVELYREDEFVVIAPPKHPLTKKASVPLKLLANEPLIAYKKGTPFRQMIEQRFVDLGLRFNPKVEIDIEMGSREAVKSAVANGIGIGFLTKIHVVGDVKAGRVKILKVPELKLKRSIYIAVHKNRRHVPLISSFRAFLKNSGKMVR